MSSIGGSGSAAEGPLCLSKASWVRRLKLKAFQAGKFAGEVLQAHGTFLGIFEVPKCGDALADFDDEYPAHGFEGVAAVFVLGEFGFVLAEVIEPVDALLLLEPILVAGAPPFGEVLVGDGPAFKFFSQQLFGFGKGIEPFEEFGALFAVFEATI